MKTLLTVLALVGATSAAASTKSDAKQLSFDKDNFTEQSLTLPTGQTVKYKAYTGLYYVTNIEDSTYQYMNVYIPEDATQQTPIFMPNSVGGYMAAAPGVPDAGDASGRALVEGYVVVMPGVRGRNSVVTDEQGNQIYTGRAPKAILDLKAAVRYLRLFDKEMLGDAEKIITNGTSAGGAMSSLLGATGNHPDYEPLLKEMGAADTRDDVFASVCFCPIIDLDHADMAYEWLYHVTNNATRPINSEKEAVSKLLADNYPEYLSSLNLKTPEGEALTADNYRDYLKKLLIESAQIAKDAGATIPDTIGLTFSGGMSFNAPINGGMRSGKSEGRQAPSNGGPGPGNGGPAFGNDRPAPGNGGPGPGMMRSRGGRGAGEYIIDLDLDKYLNYVVTTQPLKSAPAFDSKDVASGRASGENEEFGNAEGSIVNYTDFSLQQATGDASATVSDEIKWNVRLLNPMNYIDDPQATTAQHWYIRHGARDRDTSFNVPVNLALKLQNNGKDVDFRLPWNRPHSGDYALNELFAWIKNICE